MKEYPILFSAEMVRVILDGRKTQTRRVIKTQPYHDSGNVGSNGVRYKGLIGYNYHSFQSYHSQQSRDSGLRLCPYGYPGDRLWVRETFAIESCREVGLYPPPFTDGRPLNRHDDETWGEWWEQPHYKATDPPPELEIGTGDPGVKWSPSIHMPRWASRITLEIVNVRVERVQEIASDGIIQEGIVARSEGIEDDDRANRLEFIRLWDSLNAKRGFGWDVNPLVWVIEFKRVNV